MKHIIGISDSFVHPVQKMKKEIGNVGHGERRLYVGNDAVISNNLVAKPWVFNFSDYSNKRDPITVNLVRQDGNQDTRRFYLGVKNTSKENITLFDEVRKNLIPQKTCFVVEESEDKFICKVLDSENVEKTKNNKGYSKIAIRWLEYESQRIGHPIQHSENKGEFCIRTEKGYKWPVDGYCENTNTIYEFYGDYYHGNPKKFKETDLYHGVSYSVKWEKDKKKIDTFKNLGYNVVTMWESDWIEFEKSVKMNNSQTDEMNSHFK